MLVAYMLAGARGLPSVRAPTSCPELVLAVYDAVRAGKLDDALRVEARLRQVQAACAVERRRVAAYKAAVASSGVGEPWLVPPRLPLTEAETAELVERLTARSGSAGPGYAPSLCSRARW